MEDPRGVKTKKTLLAEYLGLTYNDVCEIVVSVWEKLNTEISRLPIKEQIKAWCIVFEFFIGKPKK